MPQENRAQKFPIGHFFNLTTRNTGTTFGL